jgi:hypothetical protein
LNFFSHQICFFFVSNERGAELVSKDTIMQQEEGDAELMAAFFPLRHLIVFFQMISYV